MLFFKELHTRLKESLTVVIVGAYEAGRESNIRNDLKVLWLSDWQGDNVIEKKGKEEGGWREYLCCWWVCDLIGHSFLWASSPQQKSIELALWF